MTPNDRIKKEAAKAFPLTNGNDLETGKRIGYIAGATAEHDRAKVQVDALEWIKTYGPVDELTVKFIDKALEQWEGKDAVVKQEQEPAAPVLGICKECKDRAAVTDYNGHGHYVCRLCDDSLNREFDEEYK